MEVQAGRDRDPETDRERQAAQEEERHRGDGETERQGDGTNPRPRLSQKLQEGGPQTGAPPPQGWTPSRPGAPSPRPWSPRPHTVFVAWTLAHKDAPTRSATSHQGALVLQGLTLMLGCRGFQDETWSLSLGAPHSCYAALACTLCSRRRQRPVGCTQGRPSHSLGLLWGLSWGRWGPKGVSGPLLRPPFGAAAISVSICLQGRVCGLCGNFDDNALNDFTTRSQSVVGDALEFGNSWKFPAVPGRLVPRDPCTANPYRRSWAQKQCSITSNSATFSAPATAHVRSGPSGTGEGGMEVALGSPPPSEASCGRAGPRAPGETGPGGHQAAVVAQEPPRCLKPFSPAGGASQVLRGLRGATPAPATGATRSASARRWPPTPRPATMRVCVSWRTPGHLPWSILGPASQVAWGGCRGSRESTEWERRQGMSRAPLPRPGPGRRGGT